MSGGTQLTGACREALGELVRGASRLDLRLTPAQQEQFVMYCGRLLETNLHTNLTAIRTPSGVMTTLFLDSLTVILALRGRVTLDDPVRLVDVGAGAGFPGLPLKILFPHWKLTLVESVGKKSDFLQGTSDELGLTGVSVVRGRVEEAAQDRLRDRNDICTARAVSALPSLIELCAPLVRTSGYLVFPKSGAVDAEVTAATAAARRLRCRLAAICPVPEELGLGEGRALVMYEKMGSTPREYPRRVGLAQNEPIRS